MRSVFQLFKDNFLSKKIVLPLQSLTPLSQAAFPSITSKSFGFLTNLLFPQHLLDCFLPEHRASLCHVLHPRVNRHSEIGVSCEFSFCFFHLPSGGTDTVRPGPRGRGHIRSATSLPSARRKAAGSLCRRSQLLTPNGGLSRSSRLLLMAAAPTFIHSSFNPCDTVSGQP